MDKSAFDAAYKDVAQRTADKLGVPAEALLAQWGLETGFGKSIIPGTNNLGNIKDISGKGVSAKDNLTGSVDKYRTYGSVDEFANDFANLITRRYPKALNQPSVEGFASALKAGGYAEDANYVDKIVTLASPKDSKQPRFDSLKEAVQAANDSRRLNPDKFKPNYIALQLDTEGAIMKNSNTPGVLGYLGAAIAGNTDQRILRLFADEFPEEPGYKADFSKLPLGADRDLVEAYARTKSTLAADKVLRDFNDEATRQETIGRLGPAGGFALSLGGEIASVTNWLTGFAASASLARTGYGSVQALRSGNYAKAIASNVAENVLSGTVVEAALSSAEGKFDLQSTGINLVADALIGASVGGWGARSHSLKAGQDLVNHTRAATFAEEVEYATRAEARLGPNATTEEVVAEVEKIKREEQLAIVPTNTARSNVFDIDRLVPEEVVPESGALKVANDLPTIDQPKAEYDTATLLTWREEEFLPGGVHADAIPARTQGTVKTLADLHALPPGVHFVGSAVPVKMKPAVDTAMRLTRKFLGDDFRFTISGEKIPLDLPNGDTIFANADVVQVSSRAAMIRVDPELSVTQQIRAVVHEIGHAVFNKYISTLAPKERAGLVKAFQDFLDETDPDVARNKRFSLLNSDQAPEQTNTPALISAYERNWDEFSAEQFVKYVEDDVNGDNKLGLAKGTVAVLKAAIQQALEFLGLAKRQNIGVTNEYKALFDSLAADVALTKLAQADTPALPTPPAIVSEFLHDPDALKYGLTTLPLNTPAERKKAQAISALHKLADNWAVANPKDAAWDKRAKNWADNDVFNVASTGLILLKSENNLVRMLASELLEDASGVSGKKGSTASITKYLVERRIMGNSLPEIEEAYGIWSANKKGSNLDNLSGGVYRKEFNRSVFELVERQGKGENIRPDTPENAALLKAAAVVQATFKRSATEQINAKTLGSGALEDGVGYMPHKINPKMVMALTNGQTRVLHRALTDQFITIEGWDISFSDMLASKYLERVQRRAHGDYSSSLGGNSADTADLLRETLMGMNLPEQIVEDHMARFTKGAANFTKKRLDLDLHQVYDVDGKAFKLLDVFETDPIALMRSQAQRASGDVALASKGIKGKPGMQLMREAMRYGETGKKATDAEFGAFDQTAAEFFGDPFGTQSTRWMSRAMSANTLIRLGGMGFNQLSEAINGVFHVGVLRTFASITSIPRLKAEIDALVRGEKVDNPIIGSIEASGTEFGVDSHRVVLPYDSPDHAYPTYGQDTLTMTDRLLRGGGYLQAKLSGWRLIHSTQQRGMAEQITHKVMRYIKEGKEDEALKGFGVNDNLRAAIAADMDKIAVFGGNGGLTALDITKMTDPAVASELVQVIHRGVNQIIQGTFIGERGKWVHDGWLKLLTEFRSFSITSMEKQWGRQRNSHGVFAAAGMLLGAMSMAAPIYMARVYTASVGREDQQAYIEQRLTPQGIAKGTMNYVAMSGLLGDFVDLLTAVAPDKLRKATKLHPAGARVDTESEFIGTFLAPSAGLVDDAWKYLQSPDDLKEGAKLLPFGRLPYLIPLLNGIPKPERD